MSAFPKILRTKIFTEATLSNYRSNLKNHLSLTIQTPIRLLALLVTNKAHNPLGGAVAEEFASQAIDMNSISQSSHVEDLGNDICSLSDLHLIFTAYDT